MKPGMRVTYVDLQGKYYHALVKFCDEQQHCVLVYIAENTCLKVVSEVPPSGRVYRNTKGHYYIPV